MTIECLEFKKGGYSLDPEKDDMQSQIQEVLRDPENFKIRTLGPGSHDLTPREWEDPNYRYWVNIENNGMGTVRMVPAVEGASSRFVEEREWTKGVREHPLKPGSEPVVIVGGNKERSTGLAVYKIIYWSR